MGTAPFCSPFELQVKTRRHDTLREDELVTGSAGRGPAGTFAKDVEVLTPVWTIPDGTLYLRFFKRAADVVVSALGMVLGFPLACLIALAIKLDSPGPVLFRQVRVGQGGKPFVFYKFRSMYAGAEGIKREYLHLNEMDGPVFKLFNDPRITRVGRLLRKSSLDELPQLYNVFINDMSLVGPRPPVPEEVRLYKPWQMRRLAVKPGITCLWQVSGRSYIGFDEWMRLDIQYIQNRSFLLDLRILAMTVPAVISGKGAY
jgi:exopolysaccharide biosynthesis polyprenyl glycosylphosphotransferase